MAGNNQLIEGQRQMRGGIQGSGYTSYASSMRPVTTDTSIIRQANAEKKAKAKSAINEANSYMSKMKSDFDFTGLDDDTQKSIREFLIVERGKYAEAASALSKIDDHTSPEYQYYVDQMNSVNQSFGNLSEQLKAYRENKLQYGELTKSSQWSLGAGDEIANANSVFGLSDKKAKLSVLAGGKLGYDLGDGNIQSFDNFEMPTMRAYDTANSIMGLANEYYNKGIDINPYAESVISSSVDKMLSDPSQLKSLVSGDFDTDGLSFGDIEWSDDIEGIRQQVKERVIQGVRDAASAGKAYKDSKTGGKQGNSAGSSSSGGTRYADVGEGYSKTKTGKITEQVDAMTKSGIPTKFGKAGIKFTPVEQESGNPIYQATINGQVEEFTYDELLEFLPLL